MPPLSLFRHLLPRWRGRETERGGILPHFHPSWRTQSRKTLSQEDADSQNGRQCHVPVLEENAPLEGMLVRRAVFKGFGGCEMRQPGLLELEPKRAFPDEQMDGEETEAQTYRKKQQGPDEPALKKSDYHGTARHPLVSLFL